MTNHEFSLGALHGWHGILLGLLGSLLFLGCGWQDKRRRVGVGAMFWLSLALVWAGGVIWLGVGARIWVGALLGVTFFSLEVWLIWSWWRKTLSS